LKQSLFRGGGVLASQRISNRELKQAEGRELHLAVLGGECISNRELKLEAAIRAGDMACVNVYRISNRELKRTAKGAVFHPQPAGASPIEN